MTYRARPYYVYSTNFGRDGRHVRTRSCQTNRAPGKLVRFSRTESCPAKVSRPAGIDVVVSGGNK